MLLLILKTNIENSDTPYDNNLASLPGTIFLLSVILHVKGMLFMGQNVIHFTGILFLPQHLWSCDQNYVHVTGIMLLYQEPCSCYRTFRSSDMNEPCLVIGSSFL